MDTCHLVPQRYTAAVHSVIQTWFMETCPQRYTTLVYGHVSTVGYGNIDCVTQLWSM